MKLEQLSYKTLTVALLVGVATLSLAHTLIAKREFRDAAIRTQTTSLARVIEVASNETLKNLRTTAYTMGSALQERLVDPASRQLREGEQLKRELEEISLKGFVGARLIDLVELRVYDSALQLRAKSGESGYLLPPLLPPFLMEQAQNRQGAERLKALGGLWLSPSGPLYSLLIPVGGLRLTGYLEVVVNPTFNLANVAEMTRLPLRITSMEKRELYASPQLPTDGSDEYLPVRYLLSGADGQPLYQMTAYENIGSFYTELHATQLRTTLIFVAVTLLVLVLVLLLLNRFLFRPVSKLIVNVEQCVAGDLDTPLEERGVKEVHIIAHAFNVMSRTLRNHVAELQRISSLDGLTGIANRRAFDTRLEQEWSRALRHHTPLALMLIDIDYFKRYNDALGHQAGDHCLREVAALMQQEMKRPTDMVARYGGEEFVVLLPETDSFGAGIVALKLREALQQRAIPHPASDISPIVTMSIGVNAVTPAYGEYPHALIESADRALYEVKRTGRNAIGFATQEKEGTGSSTEDSPEGQVH